jgi:centromeric protein E
MEANEAANGADTETENISAVQCSPNSWRNTFREQMQQIFMLWDECYVSIIHRTQFYLLFQGDQADQIYIEVELRRLMWLHQHFNEVGDASPAQMCGDDPSISISSRY